MNVFEVVELLKNTNSSLEKLSILEKNKNVPFLKEYFQMCLTPTVNYWIRPMKDIQGTGTKTLAKDGVKVLNTISSRELTGNAARDLVSSTLSSLTPEDAILFNNILDKSPNCGVSVATVNKIWENLINLPIKLMKAQAYSDKALEAIHFPAISQRKCDGARCLLFKIGDEVTMYSSGNREYTTLDSLKEEAKKIKGDFVLDGELLAMENGKTLSRKIGNGLLTKSIKGTISKKEAEKIHMVCWDLIDLESYANDKDNVKYSDKMKYLEKVLKNMKKISLVESKIVNSKQELIEHFKYMLKRGEEGVIVKNADSHWENKRSKQCVKMKIIQEFTLELIGVNEGSGKLEGTTGAIVAASKEHLLTVAVSGMSDEMRKYFWDNQKELIKDKVLIEVIANGIIQSSDGSYSLFLPRFSEIRENKPEGPDTLEYIKALSDGSGMLLN